MTKRTISSSQTKRTFLICRPSWRKKKMLTLSKKSLRMTKFPKPKVTLYLFKTNFSRRKTATWPRRLLRIHWSQTPKARSQNWPLKFLSCLTAPLLPSMIYRGRLTRWRQPLLYTRPICNLLCLRQTTKSPRYPLMLLTKKWGLLTWRVPIPTLRLNFRRFQTNLISWTSYSQIASDLTGLNHK